MRISHRHHFIFFSNPKTGSESVRSLLDPYSDIRGVPMWEMDGSNPFYSHIRPVEVRDEFRTRDWDFDAYFKFSFVRNPWARLVSLYRMIFEGSPGRAAGMRRRLARGVGLHPSPAGFRRWVRTVQTDGPGGGGPPDQRWQVYGTYSARAYFGDEEGRFLVDRIIRLEDMDRDLPETLARIGLPGGDRVSIPKVNVRGGDHRPYYDEATASYVGRMYADDIERFGYSFDGATPSGS